MNFNPNLLLMDMETEYDIRPLVKKKFANYGRRVRVKIPSAWLKDDMLDGTAAFQDKDIVLVGSRSKNPAI
jgi:hypothetical protein